MILRNMTLEQFAENIRQKKQKIVIYGYGAIGKVAVPAFMAANRLEAQILFYADADVKKQGQRIRVGNRQVEVAEPGRMREIREAFAKGMEVYWYDSEEKPFELRAVKSWREEWDAVQVCK